MNLRKALLTAVAFGAMSALTLVNAQESKKGGRGGGTPEQRLEQLEQAVGSLTADQKAKIKAIYAKSAEKMQGLSQDDREKRMEIYQASAKEIREVLNAEQQKKYDEMMAQRMQGRGGKGGKKKEN
jgi:Spy/CpxP family protein refolding chaperone